MNNYYETVFLKTIGNKFNNSYYIISDVDLTLTERIILVDVVEFLNQELTINQFFNSRIEKSELDKAIARYKTGGEEEKNAVLDYFLECLVGIDFALLVSTFEKYFEQNSSLFYNYAIRLLYGSSSTHDFYIASSEPDFVIIALVSFLRKHGVNIAGYMCTGSYIDINGKLSYLLKDGKKQFIRSNAMKGQIVETIERKYDYDPKFSFVLGDHPVDDLGMKLKAIEYGAKAYTVNPKEEAFSTINSYQNWGTIETEREGGEEIVRRILAIK